MRILLTNDDGINAPGLAALAKAISEIADINIVAPATEMSAVGHAITLSDPLKVTEVKKNDAFFGHAVSGTPADCVKLAHWVLYKDQPKPDLLISGINLGSNTGINTIYSGTVSAATEGAILDIPSFAISLTTFINPDFTAAAKFAAKFAQIFPSFTLPKGVYLNINIPALPEEQIKGVKITRQGMATYEEKYHVRDDPFGRQYYWLTGEKRDVETDVRFDDAAINNNYISITPVHFDLTYYDILHDLDDFNFNDKLGLS